MMTQIAVWSALQQRLLQLKPDSEVVLRAVEQNPWFLPREVVRAAHAVADKMLSREPLCAWLSAYAALPVSSPCDVLIVMAGNLPLVGFFDLLCVVVAGHRAVVKPSSKDRVLMEWVVEQLRDIDPEIPIVGYENQPVDAVIATGSNRTREYFSEHYAGCKTLLRGTRYSVAVLTGDESPEELQGLSDDLFAYSGLGCRNVSHLFLPMGYRPRIRVPEMNPLYQENYRAERALRTMVGEPFEDWGGALCVEKATSADALSVVRVVRYAERREVERWLEEHEQQVQCVVSREGDFLRGTTFGQAQQPTLMEYPDGVDTLLFLSELNNKK